MRLLVGEAGASYQANLCQTVGKLLQDIINLLATASSDAERQVLDDWKHHASRMQCQTSLSIAEAQPMLREANSVLESTHDKQELREAANTFNVIVKNKDDIAAIVTQAMEMMTKSQELKRSCESREDAASPPNSDE